MEPQWSFFNWLVQNGTKDEVSFMLINRKTFLALNLIFVFNIHNTESVELTAVNKFFVHYYLIIRIFV